MINRLVGESTIKVPFRGQPLFSINKRLLCFQADTHIKIKPLSREAKDIQIPFNNAPLQSSLSQWHSWLYELTPAHLLQVYQLEYLNGIPEGSSKKIAILHNVQQYQEVKGGLIIVASNNTIKSITFKEMATATEVNLNIDANTLASAAEGGASFILKSDPYSERFLITKCSKQDLQTIPDPSTDIFDRIANSGRFEKTNSLTYLTNILALYQDRYAFQRRQDKDVEIYDIEESKLIGRFNIEGNIKYSCINNNLLLIIITKEQTDYFHFFVLNPAPAPTQPLITNRAVYQKGRADHYQVINLLTTEANVILDKKKNSDFADGTITKVTENTSTILYALNKTKEKVQIIKLDHSKLLKSPFGEEKLDKVVYSKKIAPPQNATESVEYERSRIHSSIELKAGEKSMQELQKKFVENLIDIKLKSVLARFQKLEKKVQNLERLISSISEKVQLNLARINREEIRMNVEKLFDSLTPQFQRYFTEIFKQVAGVLQQGVGYYNLKLAKQAEMHKQALTQIVTETFKATEDIVQIGKKEQGISQRTEEHLKRILDSKKRWTKSTEDYEARLKEVPTPSLKTPSLPGQSKPEGKVFVRADLNYPNSRREG